MTDRNKPLPFDFAKDFDREDEDRKLAEKVARKKTDAELRSAAGEFAKKLRRIAQDNRREAATQKRVLPNSGAASRRA